MAQRAVKTTKGMEAESETVCLTLELPVSLLDRLERQAAECGMSLNDFVVCVLTKIVEQKEV